jgi:3-hydroxyisobutyrate dehydrogenase
VPSIRHSRGWRKRTTAHFSLLAASEIGLPPPGETRHNLKVVERRAAIMSDIGNIGFIGMGNMGVPMAANLVRAGYTVTAYDIAADRAQRFAQDHAARAAASLSDLGGGADMVITMLPSGREVRQVLLDAQGGALLAGMRAGTIAVDMSSSAPLGTRALGAELGRRGIALIDAPVSGGVPRANDATLAIMIGGEAAAVAVAKPVLSRMGQRLFEVGGLGCGHAMKALNNFLAGTSFAAAAEAVMVGRRFGLDPAVMTDVLNVSTGKSFATENLIKQHVLNGSFATGFALDLLTKDVGIAADLAEEVGVDAPIGRLVRDLYGSARDGLGANRDHTQAAAYWEARALRRAAE